MHSLLEKLFAKRGIKDATELDEEERQEFDNWNKTLSKETLTTEDIKKFCQSQVEMIEGKWRDLTLEQTKKAEMIPYHIVYKTISQAIDSPLAAREQLEQYLQGLLNRKE